MADTIVTNTPASNNDSGAAGWVVAFVILIAIIVAGFVLYQRGFFMMSGQAPASPTNINVTVPNPIAPTPTTP